MSDFPHGKYPITGSVWFRESTQEWVLELEGSINGTYFIDRHQATLATEKPTSEAGVYTARGIGDLSSMVASLAQQGFRIVTVIDTQNRDYHVVAQKESEK